MSQASLHLVRPGAVQTNPDALYFERRSTDRFAASGHATAVVARPPQECFFGEPSSRICSLELVDLSDTGLGGLSDEPLPIGAQITVFIAPRGAQRGYDRRGTVVRCQPRNRRHHIAVRFTQHDWGSAA